MERHRRVIGTKRRIFAALGVASLLLATIGADAASAAPPPEGLKATFSGALKGKAKGGTSDALCVFTARPVTPDEALTLPGAVVATIGVVTTHWDDFTVKGKQASLSLEIGSPVGSVPDAEGVDVPWAAGAPRGSAELIVTTPDGEFVTTPASKDLVVTRESKSLIDTTLKVGKKKLHVKATIDCLPGDTEPPNPANPAQP